MWSGPQFCLGAIFFHRVQFGPCQLQIGTCQEHLPVTEEQHQHLPSACDAAAAENEALCSRETGGKGLSVQFSSVTGMYDSLRPLGL